MTERSEHTTIRTIPPLAQDNEYLAYLAAQRKAEGDGYGPTESEEIGIKAAFAWLQTDYQERAKPWLERLCQIEMRKPMRPIILPDGSITLGR